MSKKLYVFSIMKKLEKFQRIFESFGEFSEELEQ